MYISNFLYTNLITASYIDAMISNAKESGPYIVVTKFRVPLVRVFLDSVANESGITKSILYNNANKYC